MSKNRAAIAFALILMFAMTVSLVALPAVEAQTVSTFITHMYVTAQPVTGVGQPMFLIYWTDHMPPDIGEQSGAVSSPSGRAGWYDVTLIVTKPDGTEETFDMPYSDPVGGGYLSYTPTEVGNYSVVADFPGEWKNSTSFNRWYTPAVSPPDPFVVQD